MCATADTTTLLSTLLERGQGGETHRGAKGVKHTGGRNLGETHREMQIGPLAIVTSICLVFALKPSQLTSISVQISF